MGRASENLVHWTLYVRFVPLGRFGVGSSSGRVRKAKFTITGTDILNIVWLGIRWAKLAGPAKNWYTGPCMSGLYLWGGLGRV